MIININRPNEFNKGLEIAQFNDKSTKIEGLELYERVRFKLAVKGGSKVGAGKVIEQSPLGSFQSVTFEGKTYRRLSPQEVKKEMADLPGIPQDAPDSVTDRLHFSPLKSPRINVNAKDGGSPLG